MGHVTGRWALILVIGTTVPTFVTHLMDKARWTTVVYRTLLALLGSGAVGILLEWYVHQIKEHNKSQLTKGQHLDMTLGPDQDLINALGSAPGPDSKHGDGIIP